MGDEKEKEREEKPQENGKEEDRKPQFPEGSIITEGVDFQNVKKKDKK